MSEHSEHIARRLADGWYALHTCQECKREFNSPSTPKPLSLEQTAKLVYDTCCEYFGPGHEEHSIPIIAQAIREARSEVLAAVSKHRLDMDEGLCACGWESKGETWAEHILALQPAASDLEELLEQAHEAALPHAAEQLVKALTEGGEFAVDSPLAKVKKRVEELLREERIDEAKQVRTALILGTLSLEECDKRIAELEKARAILGELKR